MKLITILISSLIALAPFAYGAETQVFPTSAGPVKITPLYHASTLIEAGGKVIYLDPAKPAKLVGLPKADLILITDIHGDHMVPNRPSTDRTAGPGEIPGLRFAPAPRPVQLRPYI